MAIDRNRIGHISPWKNNCAVATVGDFVAEQLVKGTLPKAGVDALLKMFQDYYQVKNVTREDLVHLFEKYNQPLRQQEILAVVFRHYLKKSCGFEEQDNEMLDNTAFDYLAKALQFNVRFHIDEKAADSPQANIKKVIDTHLPEAEKMQIHLDSQYPTLDVYFHNKHFDRIMASENEAAAHNQHELDWLQRLQEDSTLKLPFDRDQSEQMKAFICAEVEQFQRQRDVQVRDYKDEKHSKPSSRESSPRAVEPQYKSVPPSAEQYYRESKAAVPVEKDWKTLVKETIEMKSLKIQSRADVNESQLRSHDKVAAKVVYTVEKDDKDAARDKVIVISQAEQIRLDHELAKELQAEEDKKAPSSRR